MRIITNVTVDVPERYILIVTDPRGREELTASDDYFGLRSKGRLTRGAGRADLYDDVENQLYPI